MKCPALPLAAVLLSAICGAGYAGPVPEKMEAEIRMMADEYARHLAVECSVDKAGRYRCVGHDGSATVTFEQADKGMEQITACPHKVTKDEPCLSAKVPQPARRQRDLRVSEMVRHALALPVGQCRLLRQGEHLGAPQTIEIAEQGYLCFAQDSSLAASFAETEFPSVDEFVRLCPREILSSAAGCEHTMVRRPPTRLKDLQRFDAINVYNWAEEARRYASSPDGRDYAVDFEKFVDRAIKACVGMRRFGPANFDWAGRISKNGDILVGKVTPASPLADCISTRVAASRVHPPPPGDYCCTQLRGGYPIAFHVESVRKKPH